MKKDIKKLWLDALRSGEYKQGREYLCRIRGGEERFCCLGVLIDVALDGDWEIDQGRYEYRFKNSGFEIGSRDLRRLGLSWPQSCDSMDMNDVGRKSFKSIAEWIEKNIPED